MRRTGAILLIGAAYALAGCGATASQAVQAKLQQFDHAVAARDVSTLCTQVLASSLVQRLEAADISCDQAMRIYVETVSDPTLSISKVSVHGSSASAVVLAGARGQTAALEAVQLIDTAHGWRLSSLATPR